MEGWDDRVIEKGGVDLMGWNEIESNIFVTHCISKLHFIG